MGVKYIGGTNKEEVKLKGFVAKLCVVTPDQLHQENVSFTFCTFLYFFYLPQVRKVQFWISSDYFSQEIPFTFYHFLILFWTFLTFFQNKIQKIV